METRSLPRCYLLGAGASTAVGRSYNRPLPTNRDFFQYLKNMDSITYSNIENILKPMIGGIEGKLTDLPLEEAEDLIDKVDIRFKGHVEDELKRAVYTLLGAHPGTTNPGVVQDRINGNTSPNLQLYDLIVRNLSDGDFFLVLNYDILLEISILSKRGDVNYSSKGMLRSPLDESIKQLSTLVFKPHGSLNWDSRGNILPSVVSPREIQIATRLSVVNNPALLNVWQNARDALQTAHELIVIGSSLSNKDNYLSAFLKIWIERSNHRDTRTKVVDIGARMDAEQYYQSVLRGLKGVLGVWNEGFNERSILDFILN